jgi:hypothetical protein
MKTGFRNSKICGLVWAVVFLTGCDKVEPLTISSDFFSLDLWSDWKFQRGQGIDSYVGIFTDGDEEIRVDYGYFALNHMDNILATPETVYFEETIIDGHPAKIVKRMGSDGGSTLSLYILPAGSVEGAVVYIWNSTDDAKYIAIFRTFRFL